MNPVAKLLIMSTAITTQLKGENDMNIKQQPINEATSITIKAQAGQEKALEEFLSKGAAIIEQTEPNTLQWFALKESGSSFRIIDFFAHQKGREEHFAGKVAAALAESSAALVQGGWEQGVVKNIQNSQVLGSVLREGTKQQAKIATYISLRAKAGQEEKLAELLTAGAKIVADTEEQTLVWHAVRLDKSNFAIYDVFPNEEARAAHFAGKVAAALNELAEEIVEGGWERGVVQNIHNSTILSHTF